MVYMKAMLITSYFKKKKCILIFPTSFNPKTKLLPTSYPITENELGHTREHPWKINKSKALTQIRQNAFSVRVVYD